MNYDQVAILIPAYKPDERLITLVDALRACGFTRIVAVDDGGGDIYQPIFQRLQGKAEVLTHTVNMGKGAALKTGIRHLMKTPGVSVVTADADGQHTPEDCRKIADALIKSPQALILGVRDKKQMPPRSKVGNNLTCFFFGAMTGLWISDTQTGLRGLPAASLEAFSNLDGDRYEYELNMLIRASREKIDVKEVEIDTIYIDNNASSHFSALKDGMRIYALLFRQLGAFIGSSLIAAGADYGVFFLLQYLAFNDLICVYGARGVSSLINYFINREVVFKCQRSFGSVFKYYVLVATVALGSYMGIKLFGSLGMNLWWAKICADLIMFIFSYSIQQKIVFRPKEQNEMR